jgi:hypothetical protein
MNLNNEPFAVETTTTTTNNKKQQQQQQQQQQQATTISIPVGRCTFRPPLGCRPQSACAWTLRRRSAKRREACNGNLPMRTKKI